METSTQEPKVVPVELVALLETFDEPAIIIGTDYEIVAANEAYRQHYGDAGPVAGKRCHAVSHGYEVPCDVAGESCPLSRCQETGHTQRELHIHHTSRGDEHITVEIRPIKDCNGAVCCFLERLFCVKSVSTQASDTALVGRSVAFNRVIAMAERVAPTNAAVLLLGESGTGKDLVAQAIHGSSTRHERPFVPVECSGLTESLFESELFGHEKGAFTGAHARRTGLVESAHGGTLFLDEVGDIPLNLQIKLLRLLETGTYRRVGSVTSQQADFRLICATHRDLDAMVHSGDFRQDLFYRISAFPIRLPPLRERREDIPLLVESLLQRVACGRSIRVDPDAMLVLMRYGFSGNVRELRNMLERASLLADGEVIQPRHLMDVDAVHVPQSREKEHTLCFEEVVPLSDVEQRYLLWAFHSFEGNRRELAQHLGLSERTLYRRLERLSDSHLAAAGP